MSTSQPPTPIEIALRKRSNVLSIRFDDGQLFDLEAEFLRVHAPSADVQGHNPSQAVLQTGKENVALSAVEPVGNYAVRLEFDDGHGSGVYTWAYLYKLGRDHTLLWQRYLDALKDAGYQRHPTRATPHD